VQKNHPKIEPFVPIPPLNDNALRSMSVVPYLEDLHSSKEHLDEHEHEHYYEHDHYSDHRLHYHEDYTLNSSQGKLNS